MGGYRGENVADAHIGFDVRRYALRKWNKMEGDFPEGVSELWMGKREDDNPATPYARYGAIHRTPMERVTYGEEDMLFDDYKNDNGRGYYEYIYKVDARKRNKMEYLDQYGPPNFFTMPEYFDEEGKPIEASGTYQPDQQG